MRRIKVAFWTELALLAVLWLAADPFALQPSGFLALRGSMVQLSGLLAMTCMSLAMILALRSRWPERWIGGLDKMYRLHKWLGMALRNDLARHGLPVDKRFHQELFAMR